MLLLKEEQQNAQIVGVIAVPVAVPELLHEPGRRIAHRQWDGERHVKFCGSLRTIVCLVCAS